MHRRASVPSDPGLIQSEFRLDFIRPETMFPLRSSCEMIKVKARWEIKASSMQTVRGKSNVLMLMESDKWEKTLTVSAAVTIDDGKTVRTVYISITHEMVTITNDTYITAQNMYVLLEKITLYQLPFSWITLVTNGAL